MTYSNSTSGESQGIKREWTRFTPFERAARFIFYVLFLSAIMLSLRTIEVIPEFLYDATEQVADMLNRMWPTDQRY